MGDRFGAGLTLLAGTLSAGALSYVAVTISARVLGTAEYGLLGTLLGVTSIATVALRPLHSAATHLAATALTRGDLTAVRGIAGRVLVACLAGAIVSWILVTILYVPIGGLLRIENPFALSLTVPLLASLACWQGLSGLLLGVHRFTKYTLATVFDAGIRAVFMLPLAYRYGVPGALVGYAIGVAAANLFAIYGLGGFAWSVPRGFVSPSVVRVGSSWILLTILLACLQNLDLIFLRAYAPVEKVGWYAAASSLANLAFTASAPLYLPLYPRLVAAHEQHRPTRPIVLRTLLPVVVTGAGIVSVTTWFGADVATFLFGNEFAVAGGLLPGLVMKTTALLAFLIVGQYAIVLGRSGAVVVSAVPALLVLLAVATLHLRAEDVALVMSCGTAMGTLAAGWWMVRRTATGSR